MIKVRDGVRLVILAKIDQTPVGESFWLLGVDFDGFIKVGSGFVKVTVVDVGKTSTVIGLGQLGIMSDGLCVFIDSLIDLTLFRILVPLFDVLNGARAIVSASSGFVDRRKPAALSLDER